MTRITQASGHTKRQRDIVIIPFGREYGSSEMQLLADTESLLVSELDGDCGGLLLDLRQTTYAGCGFLAERLGVRPAFALVQILTALGLVAVIMAPAWLAFLLLGQFLTIS